MQATIKARPKLSAPQRLVFDFIKNFVSQNSIAPTVRDICEGLGYRSTSTVSGLLMQLDKKDYIRRDPSSPRSIRVTSDEVEVEELGQLREENTRLRAENEQLRRLLDEDWIGGDGFGD